MCIWAGAVHITYVSRQMPIISMHLTHKGRCELKRFRPVHEFNYCMPSALSQRGHMFLHQGQDWACHH